jgi:hypothetical protein
MEMLPMVDNQISASLPSTDQQAVNEHIIEQNILDELEGIEKGECTLFLGAGASQSARMPSGGRAPSGDELSALIAENFLRDPTWSLNLENAIALASSFGLGNRFRIEKFITERLSTLYPSSAHKKIPWFNWRTIVTTNYDRLIEKAYETPPAAQELFAVLNEADLPRVGRSGADIVTLLKPHGCISQPGEMCLTSEDIHKAKQERRLLFSYIEMLHFEGPVIYIGYSLKDSHILSMIYDLKQRLGKHRKPILFVTRQMNARRATIERAWFKDAFVSAYYEWGFEAFMNALSRQVTPAIGPSMIVEQMSPCRAIPFKHIATAEHKIYENKKGEWECWLTYSIHNEGGFAGIFFEAKRKALDIINNKRIKFQLYVSGNTRVDRHLEALKLEGHNRSFPYLLDIEGLRGKGWQEVEIELNKYPPQDKFNVGEMPLQRIVIADNGNRATLDEEYIIGVRKIRFE